MSRLLESNTTTSSGPGDGESVPRAVSKRHPPSLDGARALAIVGVVACHLGLGWASGGYLGVDLIFVLSGFLIISLWVEEIATRGRIARSLAVTCPDDNP